MMRFPRPLGLCAALSLAAAFLACSNRVASGGGDATETGNARVAGIVLDSMGAPVRGAVVDILPSGFDPVAGAAVPDSLKDTTDAQGRYRFTRLADGEYNVLASDDASHTRLSVWGIRLGADSVLVPADTLRIPGSLVIPIPETADSGVGWIYVPGTLLRVRVDSELRIAGEVVLDSVPMGLVPAIEYAKGPGAARLTVARDIAVRSGEVTHVDAYAMWPHARKLFLNTASGTAAIAKDQRDFPLLVRLAAPSFDFSQSTRNGADVRFSAADGSPLAREIEAWDSAGGQAAIWVRVDTVHAGRADQAITMHWGPTTAAGPLRPRPVFDTLAGFAAVWHLGEEAADTVSNSLYKDATGAGSDGDDRVSSASRTGLIANGHGMDSGDYIVAAHPSEGLKLKTAFSISVWVRPDMKDFGPSGGDPLSIGDNYGLRVFNDTGLHVWFWPKTPPQGAVDPWYSATVKIPGLLDGKWHLATGTYDGATLRLYCDGKEVAASPAPDPVGLQFPMNATLGKHGDVKKGFEYAGGLDEARVHSRSRDADWIKLEYENQKPGSGFPAFGP